ncbi:pyridoxal phosphate-dependent aminotransferase [Mesorhizobium sp. WSM4887]|uniref:pyridoxal phosphate-dependent aminotransferase n=1 Tax=Mesorhizobium sp. WSM4887 TaxID=3038543 RepID=UPI002417DF53|nr:pyridoxal phosphate-dependent aminotransferase [Mesorhizobium sp. WSM4887]MDG4889744.1 pyridoxal phosphate-dependent aminotransferase [Mesorhizobium sp. WSM4887]
MSERADALQAAGKKVISLAAGELDFDTPKHIGAAACQAIDRGETRYTAVGGTLTLKKAVIAKFRDDNGLSYEPREVIVSTGAKQIIFNAMLASLDPGDEVVIPAPYWVSYPDIVEIAGAVPIIVPTTTGSGFKLSADALEGAITPRTKWLLLNSPGNPTGAVYSKAELEKLAAVLKRYPHVGILSDDIYEHLRFDDEPFHTIAAVDPALKNRTLTVNGVSKTYAMTGWRIGYAGGPADLIAAMTGIQSQSTSNPCSISQAATLAALTGNRDFQSEVSSVLRRRRDLVVNALSAVPGLKCSRPEGAFYAYPDCSALLGMVTQAGVSLDSDADIVAYLLDEALVATVPGSAFGLAGYFRVSFASSDADLVEACRRIEAAVNKLQPRQ